MKKLLLSFFAATALTAAAQTYPSKPLTLVVPNPPGGLVDTSARLVSEPLARLIGQSVVVDNKPGGSGNLAYQNVARSTKDGHTILVSYSGYHIANPILMDKLPWDLKDLTPVGLITVATNVIAVHPSVPANTLKEFIAWAKQNAGKINYASQGIGTTSHLTAALFERVTGRRPRFLVHGGHQGPGGLVERRVADLDRDDAAAGRAGGIGFDRHSRYLRKAAAGTGQLRQPVLDRPLELGAADLDHDHAVVERHFGNDVAALPGGVRKLVDIAMAFMSEPALVLLDEPCAGVNPSLVGGISTLLKELNQSRKGSFVVIEHNMDFVMDLCHRIMVMVEGQVLAIGTPAEIRGNKAVLEAYLGA